jgi:hypothetical protein
VGDRKALLIGAENYGEGFAPLPAVQHDIELMQGALVAAGYQVTICPEQILGDATKLDAEMRHFCTEGTADDVRLIYFSGHGLFADNFDCIIPAGTSRKDAIASPNQRVTTDLSRTVYDAKTGLVLFVIDACRDKDDAPVTKGGTGWGDPQLLARPSEHRFIRFFGCTKDEVCQVLPSAPGERPCSLFTKALADSLKEAKYFSLQDLLSRVEKQCTAPGSLQLRSQRPRLSYGETSAETESVLRRAIFDPVGIVALPSVWAEFDPDKMHCLVVLSEQEQKNNRNLMWLVRSATAGKNGPTIWKSFSAACNGRKLASGKQRTISAEFDPSALILRALPVLDALGSPEAFDKAIRAVAEADLVAFDVTGFEPGIMLLLGVRSATCRSVSICSHGGDWEEGQPLEIPFNLQDLNISSHKPSKNKADADHLVNRFVRRIEIGFYQLSRHPGYLDLPAYDALRQLGTDLQASSTIGVEECVLVLCSYSKEFFSNWEDVELRLREALSSRKIATDIRRIIDYGTPQLIWQGLYEQIRRTAACVVDWSEYNASVFMELGVIDKRYLPGKDRGPKLYQIESLHRLFKPIPYQSSGDASSGVDGFSDAFNIAVDDLLQRSSVVTDRTDYNRVHRTLLPVVDATHEAHSPVFVHLREKADALHHPQIIFAGSKNTKKDSERAALEMRIAAWLYLQHRYGVTKLKDDPDLRSMYSDLARSATDALYDLGDPESIEFAGAIEEKLKQLD